MKRILFAILLVALTFTGCAGRSGKSQDSVKPGELKSDVYSLLSEYKSQSGFEMIRLGSFGMALMRSGLSFAAKTDEEADDEDLHKALSAVKGVKGIAIVDYEDVKLTVRDEFNARLMAILDRSELLMEAKDGDDDVRIYGSVSGDGNTLTDMVLYVPEDCALICLFGNIPAEAVAGLAAASSEK